ncbi:Alpha/Beta hydrolase protein [Irpex lacteus]|nr:Alpha/Beta hydrolase protein [Irpex lacteus]
MVDSTQIREYIDIPYVSHPDGKFDKFDLYVPERPSSSNTSKLPPLLVFVHGGAWRSYDKSDHAPLARRLASLTSFPIAVPNYRLTTSSTPHIKHPAHAEDLHEFLKFILDWSGPEPPSKYDPGRLYLAGHSCSAHMLMSIFLSPPPPLPRAQDSNSTATSPSPPTYTPTREPTHIYFFPQLIPSPRLIASVRGFILSEGIYDLDLLLRSFPAYKDWFVAAAFGERDSYAAVNTIQGIIRKPPQPPSTPTVKEEDKAKWLVIHSTGDTLVDVLQSQGFADNLREQGADVELNDSEVTEEHNDLLRGEVYPTLVANFVLRNEKEAVAEEA